MIPEFVISLPHTLLLWSYLMLLLYGLHKGYSALTILVICLICVDSLWNIYYSASDLTLHVAGDLMFLGFVSTCFLLIKQKLYKGVWLFLSFLAFLGLHVSFIPPSSIMESKDKSIELLIQFNSKKDLEGWMAKQPYPERVTYPLFMPLDHSFLLDEYVGLSAGPDEDISELIRSFEKMAEVGHVEINDEVRLKDVLLNDPNLKRQWTSERHELNKFHKLISDREVQNSSEGSIIAILDTGIDADHEDLIDNYVSTSRRYDTDIKGHGTHCAGIAAAVTGNAIGIASFLPPKSDVKVTSIKVLNNFGIGTQKTIIDGIIKAADSSYDVISLSLGGISSDTKERAYNEAVKYAKSKGSIVVVAAGNSGSDASKYSPANSVGVIAVTATDTLNRRAAFGNDVTNIEMGLGAPGTQIYSTFPDDQYKAFDGSSMSAPFVSGLIGLMRAYDRDLTTEEAFAILKESADVRTGLYVVNPLSALKLFFNSHL